MLQPEQIPSPDHEDTPPPIARQIKMRWLFIASLVSDHDADTESHRLRKAAFPASMNAAANWARQRSEALDDLYTSFWEANAGRWPLEAHVNQLHVTGSELYSIVQQSETTQWSAPLN